MIAALHCWRVPSKGRSTGGQCGGEELGNDKGTDEMNNECSYCHRTLLYHPLPYAHQCKMPLQFCTLDLQPISCAPPPSDMTNATPTTECD